VRIKVALRAGRIVKATPEFDEAAILTHAREEPVRQVLDEAVAAATVATLIPGARWPGEPNE
jgi:pyridinium-3,5-bisthiocarboxylic acid mononucleotide nickel chelatase